MITIKFEDTYEPVEVAADLSFMIFKSEVEGGNVLLKVVISSLLDTHLPDVFNLAFGPLKADGEIDDAASIRHLSRDKVFSTILLFALTYLQSNPGHTIGLDGSDDRRAYLYHRMFFTNKAYLSDYFVSIGVDWYVKLLRNNDIERDSTGRPYFKPRPEPFDYQRSAINLYRYYMFTLR